MKFIPENIDRTCAESDIYNEVLALDGKRILELGCGAAELTRQIAGDGKDRQITAFEVDERQHKKNLAITDLPNVTFQLGGAEDIPAEDESHDIIFMFKSLHHVPEEKMDQAMQELHRVLTTEGMAYISEPVYAGDLNEILCLFHDEGHVRQQAFNTVEKSVTGGLFTLEEEIFFNVEVTFENFADFENKVLNVTHTDFDLSEEIYKEVKNRFEQHVTGSGVHFTLPVRVDLLRKPHQ